MSITFDGPSKVISFDTPTTYLSCRELWSRWVDWAATGDNVKYLMAMKTVGGDPLPGDRELGVTYFLANGWKLKPYEATHTLTIDGNLYSEDGTSPYIPVLGNYSVMVINSVSNLMDTSISKSMFAESVWDSQLSTHINDATPGFALMQQQYADRVYIDIVNGTAGQEYPVGIRQHACNSLVDALAIAAKYELGTLHIIGDIYADHSIPLDNLVVESSRSFGNSAILNGTSINNTLFKNITVTGRVTNAENAQFENCVLDTIENIAGEMINCRLLGIFKIANSAYFSGVGLVPQDNSVVVDLNSTASTASFDIDSGIITFKNAVAGSLIEVNMRGGELTLDVSCVGGDFYAEGYGTLYDETIPGSMNVIDNHLLALETIPAYVWDIPLADHVSTGSAGKALSTSSTGGVDYGALANAVWDTQSNDHINPGSIGKLLKDIGEDIFTLLNVTVGNWEIKNNQMIFYDMTGQTLFSYNLYDSAGKPSMGEVFKREVV